MTRLSFSPGPSFLEQAATATWYFLDHCGPAAAGAHVVVPTAAQIPGVRAALDAAARAAGQPRLLPRVLTLGHWLLDLPPDLAAEPTLVRSHAARLLAVQQAIRAQDWLRQAFGAQTEGAAWGLAQTLLSISDELSARWLEDAAIRDDDDVDGDDRAALLQGALQRTYAHLSERFLGQEAQIVLAFWQMLSGPDDPLPARRRALQRLALQVAGPVIWIGPTPPEPIEATFLMQVGEQMPTLEIGYDWSGGAHDADSGPDWYGTLLALWTEARRVDAEVASAEDGSVPPSTPNPVPSFTPSLPTTLPESRPRIRVIGSARFEDEAAAAADQLVQWLNEGRRHVALVAHDRVVARRARALLARAGAPVRDETGWKLSTTRAAAALMRWFDVLARDGDTSALLDLLKSPFCLPAFENRGAAIALMERQIRRDGISGGWARLRHLFAERATAARADAAMQGTPDATTDAAADTAQQTRAAARALIAILADEASAWPRGAAQKPLTVWLERLDAMLDALAMRTALAGDDAGRQLLDALARLADLPGDETGAHATLSQQEFRAMLSALLESVAYKEPSAPDASRITILPLNGARMRRFDGVVVVGCDDAQLPSSAAELMFFSNQMRRELGLEDREARFAQQARDLAEVLLNNDDVVMTWQRFGGRGEPHHVSGWIERLSACCARAGAPIEANAAPGLHETFARPGYMPAPAAPERVPARWSAQAYNMLRRCPYQFFAGRMLGLAGLEAVNDDLEKRDIGNLLHRVLLQYHEEMHASDERDAERRLARLREISDDVFGALMADDGNAIGYYRRWCEVLPSYVAWQTAREAEGWHWRGGEMDVSVDVAMPDGVPLRLAGRIDRIDKGPDGAHAVLDYKTQPASRLRRKAGDPEEDCQLPFYGLLRADAVAGSWVALEGVKLGGKDSSPGAQREVDLPEFQATVTWLERQLRNDVGRLRQGARLPAFGDAAACTYCEARGLCRKGFWESTALPDLQS
ncbi:DNA helicase/exodeoxyribonuclease V, subunit B [Cupriavidus sp. YR651]|uniref:PD-(D/E)XK nuclease family protein n=1 Tax=Cupriavidus sp. YR651 TaxID=1855315 RepID=UPI000886C750|nr:PD-(D/E)XK nuclease family protein [Cupriavidus sp. YR651]SDC08197.1 DNA helicase/exodeoxyribonuclease V, subunit B [Cupriavidus sp. YR651]